MQQRLRRNAADVEADAAELRRSARPAPCPGRGRRRGTRRCSRRGRRRARRMRHSMSALRPVAAAACGAGAASARRAIGDGGARAAAAGGGCGASAAGAARVAFAAGAAAAPSASRIATTLPSDSLSPSLTFSSPDHAGGRRRHFHRRLVRFQRDQALVLLHRVADGDQQFDHRDVVVTADVGNLHFDAFAMCSALTAAPGACRRAVAPGTR